MLRFAPSPTRDMHINDLRIALFNFILSQQKKENFIVRIEDTDTQNNIEGKDQEILDILSLFNINYSQVIYQSQNFRFHSAMALQLMHEKKAFSCFCSSEWIKKKRHEAKEKKIPYQYDDACRNLPAELVIDNINPFSIRIIKPNETISINDKLQGKIDFQAEKQDSFTILHQDKTPTYNFTCAVDDMLNDISLIIQDEKYLEDTPKQVHVRESLQYNKQIEYAHLSPILCDETLSIKSLLEAGYLPDAISNYLISAGDTTPKKIFSLQELIESFDLNTLSKNAPLFNLEQLKQCNKQYLQSLDATELSRYVGFADAEIGELARIYLDEVSTTKELKAKITPIFAKREIPEHLQKHTQLLTKIIISAPYFEHFHDFESYLIQKSGLHGEEFTQSLYTLLTNTQSGPDIQNIYKYLKNYLGEIVK